MHFSKCLDIRQHFAKNPTGLKDGKNFISIVLDVKFEFESGALGEQQADDPFMIFGGFIILGFP